MLSEVCEEAVRVRCMRERVFVDAARRQCWVRMNVAREAVQGAQVGRTSEVCEESWCSAGQVHAPSKRVDAVR